MAFQGWCLRLRTLTPASYSTRLPAAVRGSHATNRIICSSSCETFTGTSFHVTGRSGIDRTSLVRKPMSGMTPSPDLAALRRCVSGVGRPRIALLIDGDVHGVPACQLMIDYITSKADLTVRRIFVTDAKATKWRAALLPLGIEPVVIDRWHGGEKNPADIVIAMHAVELALRGDVTAIALAADDVDFAVIHSYVRQLGLDTYHVELYGSKVRRAVPKLLHDACTATFTITQNIHGEALEGAAFQYTDSSIQVFEILTLLKYMAPELDGKRIGTMSWRMSIALFVHVNNMNSFRDSHFPYYYPQDVLPAFHKELISIDLKSWHAKPEKMCCFEGISNKIPPLSKRWVRSWPYVYLFIERSENIMSDVLRGLGYLDNKYNNCVREAVELFLHINSASTCRNHESIRGIAKNVLSTCEKHEKLRELFLSEAITQSWRIPRRDHEIRKVFAAQGKVKTKHADEDSLMTAMARFLELSGKAPAATYNFRVWQCFELLSVKKDPNQRSLHSNR